MDRVIVALCAVLSLGSSLLALQEGPLPEEIREKATLTRQFYDQMIKQANDRANSLGRSVSTWRWVTKIGQFVGGGGAIVFGLNDKGRNAAYAGAVGALFTALDQGKSLGEKEAEREKCRAIERLKVVVFNATTSWELASNDPAFRKGFTKTFDEFNQGLKSHFEQCDLNLSASWTRLTMSAAK